jgi:hypothetical protein
MLSVVDRINRANRLGDVMQMLVVAKDEFKIKDNRTMLLMGQWSLAFDLHRGILCLLDNKLFGPAFSLVRPVIEATIRAHLAIMGADEEIEAMNEDKYRTNFRTIGARIDAHFGLGNNFETFLDTAKDSLHSFTHAGLAQIARRYSGMDLVANYTDDEIHGLIAIGCSGIFMANNLVIKYFDWQAEWEKNNELFVGEEDV